LTGGKDIASGISLFVPEASSTLILTSAVSSTSQITHVSIQEPASLSTTPMQFCNTATQITAVLYHHKKQDTSNISIVHGTKLIKAVCLCFIYGENVTTHLTNNHHEELFFLTTLWLLN
jgi:hypothetical protein